jgi:hypothetical protein
VFQAFVPWAETKPNTDPKSSKLEHETRSRPIQSG